MARSTAKNSQPAYVQGHCGKYLGGINQTYDGPCLALYVGTDKFGTLRHRIQDNWHCVRNYAPLTRRRRKLSTHRENNSGHFVPSESSAGGNFTMPPVTPAGTNAYQVNLNRTKTKKWVEAKVQNYDGDDWGVDEYDDDDDDEPEPAPAPAMLRPAVHATGLRYSSLPSLQTQQPSLRPEIAGIRAQHSSSGSIATLRNLRPIQDSTLAGHNIAQATASSSNVLSHVQEETAHREPQSADGSVSKPVYSSGRPKSDSIGEDKNFNVTSIGDSPDCTDGDADRQRRLSASLKLPDLPRMSTFGPDLFPPSSKGFSARKSVGGPLPEDPSTSARNQPQDGKLSTSGDDDALAAGQTFAANPVKESTDVLGSRHDVDDEFANTEIVSPVPSKINTFAGKGGLEGYTASQASEMSNASSKDHVSVSRHDFEIHTIAPLRTPSPRGPLYPARGDSLPEAGSAPAQIDSRMEEAKSSTGNGAELPPLQRRATFDTTTSSPVKDNDLLSDEILKSLSPSATPAHTNSGQLTSKESPLSEHLGADNSNSTLQDHEDAEKDTRSLEASANIPPISETAARQDVSMNQAVVSPSEKSTEWLVPSQSSTVRPRFSWEAEERVPSAQAQQEPLLSAASAGQSVDENYQNLAVTGARYMGDTASSASEIPRATGLSPRASTSSRQSATGKPTSEALDPVALDKTDNDKPPPAHAVNQSSLEDQKALNHPESNSVSSMPLSENLSALGEQSRANPVYSAPPMVAASQPSRAQSMSLRDIMNLSSSRERIAKYNESREVLACADSGLEDWLVHMSTEHSDRTPDGSLFSAQGSQQSSSALNAAAQAGLMNSIAQQPHHQQYLTTSSPNTASSPNSRGRLGSLGMPSSAVGSTFGHSGNQIGSKSKEFMQSAGKMGKGLLSKGRSKLRGTGDKGDFSEAASPNHEPKYSKAARRASWGMMLLGVKSRGDEEAMPHAYANASANAGAGATCNANANTNANANANANAVQQSAMAPQIPQIPIVAPLAPFGSAALTERPHEPGCSDAAAGAGPGSQPHSPTQSGRPSRATAGLSRLQIPCSDSLLSAGARSAPLSTVSHPPYAEPGGHDAKGAMVSPEGHLDSVPVVLPRDRLAHHQRSGSAPAIGPGAGTTPSTGLLADDRGTDPSHPAQQIDGQRRLSSFMGLPPIRRGSAFALTSRPKARRAVKRFPIDDDDEDEEAEAEEEPDYLVYMVDHAPENDEATLQNRPHPSYSSQEPTILAVTDIRGRDAISAQVSAEDRKDAVTVPHATDSQEKESERRLLQPLALTIETGTHNHERTENQTQEQTHAQAQVQAQAQAPEAQTSDFQHMVHPSQRLPASGPWKLEESKLTEPLNPVTRNRLGADGSPPQFMYGFEKEIGSISPDSATLFPLEPPAFQSPTEPPTQLPAQQQDAHQSSQQLAQYHMSSPVPPYSVRQRPDVPPSSAQRWPELFAGSSDQGASSDSRNDAQSYPAPYQPWLADDEIKMAKSQHSEFAMEGVAPPPGELGRSDRGSLLFKDLSQRVAGVASREHLAGAVSRRDQHSCGQEFRDDEASEASLMTRSEKQDRRGRRGSFFLGRSGPRSVDQGSFQESQSRPGTPPRLSKRRSTFGAGLSGKPAPSGLALSFDATAACDGPASPRTVAGAQDATLKKKRFSGIAKVSNLLSRNKHAERPASSGQFWDRPLEPPVPPFQRFGRTSTTSSFDTRSGHHSTDRDSERRRLRRPPSVSDLINGMLSKRSSSSRTGQGGPPGSGRSLTQQQQGGWRPESGNPQAMSGSGSDRYQHLPCGQSSHEILPASTPPVPVEQRRDMQPCAPREGDSGRQSFQTSPPSYHDGTFARNDVAPSSCSSSSPQLPRGQPLGQRDGVDGSAAGQNNPYTAVPGELMRPDTVSPELSTTSDWGILTEHQMQEQDGAHDARPRDSAPDVAQGNEVAALPVHGNRRRAAATDDLSPPAAPPAAGQHSGPVSHEDAVGRVVDSADEAQTLMVSDAQAAGSLYHDGRVPSPDVRYSQQPYHQHLLRASPYEDVSLQEQQQEQQEQQQQFVAQNEQPSQQGLKAFHQAKGSIGSKWKGLTKRVSRQMSGFGQHGSAAQAAEAETREKRSSSSRNSNKIFGAFKRTSKRQSDGQIMCHQPTYQQNGSRPASASWSVAQRLMHAPPSPGSQRGCSVSGAGGRPGQQRVGEETVAAQTVPEPQYDQVPIPRGYHAVHGEGMTVPSGSHVGGRPAPCERHTAQQQQQQQQVSPPICQSLLRRPDSVSSLGLAGSPWPSPPLEDRRTSAAAAPSRAAVRPPFVVDVGKANQRSDENNLYDATPRMKADSNSNSNSNNDRPDEQAVSSQDGLVGQEQRVPGAPPAGASAELEDTFGAHERRRRLATQEEKIWCNPDDDAHFQPRMAATSYPGQEWNPYQGVDVEGDD
ncbi:hypothetical protein E4U53_003041 [Claviceps sorghi]|nr:hypothetical protein E4U53_003041 [Claviceps sorghi]